MSVIYKYPVELDMKTEKTYVELPSHAKVFSARCEGMYEIYIYAIVDKEETEMIKREVLWCGTGGDLSKEQETKIEYYNFLGTFKAGPSLIWHIWIEPVPRAYSTYK